MQFDYIVVGAGSGGCAVAGRLAQDPANSVLLIEAGGTDRGLAVQAPIAFAKQFHSKGDWDYYSEAEPGLNGRSVYLPRGKVIGGSSSMNAMLWVLGAREDFDAWDVPGWAWEDCAPVFRRMEDHYLGSPHGVGGPVHVRVSSDPDPVSRLFVEAAKREIGNDNADIGGPDLEGSELSPVTVDNGRRWSAARAYLEPLSKQPNLTIVKHALVRRVIIEGGRAVGVEFQRKGKIRTESARMSVVLSAGAFGTPHLLQLSGVGPAEHLRSIGVTPVVDSPLVGANLQEHPMSVMNWEIKPPYVGHADAAKPKWLLKWLLGKTGKLTTNFSEALAHVRSSNELRLPDFQMVFAPGYVWDNGAVTHPRPAMMLAQSYWTPTSRGSVMARSSDPAEPPAIVTNLLGDDDELAAMVRAVRIARRIMASGPIGDVAGTEINPGVEIESDEDLENWLRDTCVHTYHPVGTAAMSRDTGGVLDERLRVRGVAGLRVADASAMPVIPRANTNAGSIMIGERCADFLLADARTPAVSTTDRV